MGLQSAMTTALTGLQAAETSIDVIGNNVANSNTVGFKASEVVFATQFLQTQSIGSAPSDRNGGTNPRQIGLGVKVAEIAPTFTQGTVEISSNPLDLAIQGDGFLMVQGSQGEQLYTRNGQLGLNSENQVVTSTGNKLLGYTVNDRYELETAAPVPIEIPLGGERVAQATENAVFQGVLNPTVEAGTVPGITTSETFTDAATELPDDPDFDEDDFAIRTSPDPLIATPSSSGGTILPADDYTYRITLVDLNGQESTASTEFSVTLSGANDQVVLSDLPIQDADGIWPSINIYRADGAGSTDFRLVDNVALDPVATPDFTDTVAATGPETLNTDALENGSYSYYVTYYNSANGDETVPLEIEKSIPINNGTSSIRINLDDLQAPDNSNFNKIRIYRNPTGDASTFRLVDTVDARPQPGFVASYIDKTTSAELNSNPVDHPLLDFDGAGSARAGAGTRLTDIRVNENNIPVPLFELGSLSFTGEVGGSAATSQQLDVTAETTVQDLMNFMTESLGLQGESNDTNRDLPIGGGNIDIIDGQLVVTSNFGEQNSVSIPLSAFRLTPTGQNTSQPLSISFAESQAANGPGTTSEFLVYDSLGSPITVRVTTVLEEKTSSSTIYRWYATSGDSQPGQSLATDIGNGTLEFDSFGNLANAGSPRISIGRDRTASDSPLEVVLDFSQVTSLAETNSSREAISSLSMIRQDGFPPGVLTDFIITDSGLIQGQFSNGTSRTLGQVLMARFSNNQGLNQIGNSLFAVSVNSGDPFISTPGEDGIGSLTAGAVELSNTDIGQDLVEMILAQTQYQAGSRVISTAQELLDELLALQR